MNRQKEYLSHESPPPMSPGPELPVPDDDLRTQLVECDQKRREAFRLYYEEKERREHAERQWALWAERVGSASTDTAVQIAIDLAAIRYMRYVLDLPDEVVARALDFDPGGGGRSAIAEVRSIVQLHHRDAVEKTALALWEAAEAASP